MTDGIDSYKGHEIDWAIGTVIENAESAGLENFTDSDEMISSVYEFIVETFLEEGLPAPSEDQLKEGVDQYLESIKDFD